MNIFFLFINVENWMNISCKKLSLLMKTKRVNLINKEQK